MKSKLSSIADSRVYSNGAATAEFAELRYRFGRRVGLFAGAAVIAFVAQPSFAQSSNAGATDAQVPGAATTADAAEVGEVLVTGSRVARDGFNAPTPTTVVTAEELAIAGRPNLADTLNTLPSLRGSLTPAANPAQSNTAGGNFLDLRGLGANRTLVLVNGRRFVSSLSEGPTDINAIPQALIANVDIVTGGASAAYGSDAVAGVVNLKLDNRLEGFKGSIQGGITDHNDHRNYLASLALGHAFDDGRGRVLIGAESAQNSGVFSIYDRDWGRRERGVVSNPAFTATNAEPRSLLVDQAYRSNTSYGGVITTGPLRGTQFAPDGSAIPFQNGTLLTARSMQGGDGAYGNATAVIETPTRRRSAYGRVSYDFSPNLTIYGEGSLSESRATTNSTTREDTAITIRNDNPFLPASVRSALAANGATSFVLGRYNLDYGTTRYHIRNKTARGVIGAEGRFENGWNWDAYFTHGESRVRRAGTNNRIQANFLLAADATTDLATGAAVCRNVAARAAGCVPIDLLGFGAPSPQAIDYITTDESFRLSKLSQDAGALVLRGDTFSTWAGPISSAVGLEFRRESTNVSLDALSAAFALATGSSSPYSGSVNVKEVFAETVVPLAKDVSFAQSLDLNLAGRVTDYSTSGTVATWKVGASWTVNDTIRARATLSKDIRAPSLFELYAGARSSRGDILDPVLNQTYRVESITSGNIDLKPERATTFTGGIVLSNPFIEGLSLSVDYYDIEIIDAVASLDVAAIVDRCYRDQPELCSLITRGANSEISLIRTIPQNLQSVRVRGIDYEASYRTDLAGGLLSLRGVASYLGKLGFNDGRTDTRLDGTVANLFEIGTNGQPKWRATGSATFERGRATVYGAARFISSARFSNGYTSKDFDKLKTPAIVYLDVSAQYKIIERPGQNMHAFFSVQNLLDKDPPQTEVTRSVNSAIHDVIGRVYTAGIRFEF